MSKLTNRKLLQWYREIEELHKEDSIIVKLLRPKVDEFHRQNAVRFATIKERMSEIIKRHRKCDDNGNPYSAGDKAVMLEGHAWDDYTAEMNAYLDQEVNIILP